MFVVEDQDKRSLVAEIRQRFKIWHCLRSWSERRHRAVAEPPTQPKQSSVQGIFENQNPKTQDPSSFSGQNLIGAPSNFRSCPKQTGEPGAIRRPGLFQFPVIRQKCWHAETVSLTSLLPHQLHRLHSAAKPRRVIAPALCPARYHRALAGGGKRELRAQLEIANA